MGIAMGCVVQHNAEIIFTDLDDTVVMMDAERGRYYELDRVAARIWNLFESARPVGEVCGLLAGEYDVTPEQGGHDVLAFLEEAAEMEIIGVRAPAGP